METTFLDMIREVFEIEDRDIYLTDTFKSYPEWDSLARLSLIASIDDEYGVIIPDAEFNAITTLAELFERVQNKS
jgi:acyl carrier protein